MARGVATRERDLWISSRAVDEARELATGRAPVREPGAGPHLSVNVPLSLPVGSTVCPAPRPDAPGPL